jgi:hypothetical protein
LQDQFLAASTSVRRVADLHPWAVRLTEILPGAVTLFFVTGLFWGYALAPNVVAAWLLLFSAYWLWKSWTIARHAIKGVGLVRRTLRTNVRAEYARRAAASPHVLAWEDVRHIVIIPCYKESASKVRATLTALSRSTVAGNVIPVLAMEEAEPGSEAKADALADEFRGAFWDIMVTLHPYGLPGEVRGKSSNENWAARRAYELLVDRGGLDIDHVTVTSCDADTLFHRRYFEWLTLEFATDPLRYRRFWQSPIFFYNNIWQVPAPLRVPNALSGLIQLGRLSRKRLVVFPQSSYSLSLRMAHEVGYWDPDVVPEDWHMFAKCFYTLHGNVEIRPIFLLTGNDGAQSTTTWRTLVNHYLQVRRWGWGISDAPYLLNGVVAATTIPLRKRLLRYWYFLESHVSWSTQWFFLSLGGVAPMVAGRLTSNGDLMPGWMRLNAFVGGGLVPDMLTLPTLFALPCLIPYVILITLDTRLRPAPPPGLSRRSRLLAFVWWPAISPITFFSSTLPAVDAQIRLMLGKRMEYRVTEKV